MHWQLLQVINSFPTWKKLLPEILDDEVSKLKFKVPRETFWHTAFVKWDHFLCFEVVIQIIFRLIEFHFEIFHFSAALLIFYNNITYNMLLDVILPFRSKINIVELKSALSFHLTDNCWCTMKILEMIVHMLYMGKLPDIAAQRATAIHRKLACLLKSHLGSMGKWSKGLKIQKERSKLTFVNLISDHSCGRFLETFIPI